MKPLTEIGSFLQRFDNFKDTEIRSVEVVSPTLMNVTLTAQDSARGFDWLTVKIECNGVSDAHLVDESKLSFLDMQSGISILQDDKGYAFAIGECHNDSMVKSSSLYIECNSIKYEEGSF